MAPASIGSVTGDLAIARSATATTVDRTVALRTVALRPVALRPVASLSGVDDATVAVFVTVDPGARPPGVDALICTVRTPPGSTVPNEQLIVVAFSCCGQRFPVEEMPLDNTATPAGSGSVSTTSSASEGPLFTRDSVYVSDDPAISGSGLAVFDSVTCAVLTTGVPMLALLSLGLGSAVVADTVAVLGIGPAAAGLALATREMVIVVFAGTVGAVQATCWPVTVQLPSVGFADRMLNAGFRSSTTWTFCASDAPVFATVTV